MSKNVSVEFSLQKSVTWICKIMLPMYLRYYVTQIFGITDNAPECSIFTSISIEIRIPDSGILFC